MESCWSNCEPKQQQRRKQTAVSRHATAIAILAAAAAVLWSLTMACISSSSQQPNSSSSQQPNSSSSTEAHPGVCFNHLEQQQQTAAYNAVLQELRAQLSGDITHQAVQQQLQGAKLPKGVTWQLAQQLLIDKALLQNSLREGHAAARVRAIRAHYSSSSGSSSNDTSRNRNSASDRSTSNGSSGSRQSGGSSKGSNNFSSPDASRSSSNRGILIVGGSRTHLGNAYILLRMLRDHLHCELPIEVVYYGHRELDREAANLVLNFIASQDAAGGPRISLIDGTAVQQRYTGQLQPHPDTELTSWVAKIHALCWVVSFRHVLLLDSDTLPVQNPEVLFATLDYKTHGFVIWPDFWHNLWMEAAVYKLLNLNVPWEVQPQGLAAESGQVVIDRAAHADVLEWLWLLNAHSGIVYKCVVGDKDTFKMAFQLAGKAQHYVQVSQPPLELLGDGGPSLRSDRFFHLGMGQASPDGSALLFMHRTARGKFFPWCAAKRQLRGRCQPAWLTLPVVQQQLEASVRDAGSMRFDADKIDTEWHRQSCIAAAAGGLNSSVNSSVSHLEGRRAERANAAGDGSSNATADQPQQPQEPQQLQQQQQGDSGAAASGWAMPLPACNYTIGQLPIPALPVSAIPGLQQYLAALDAVFMEVQPVLRVQLVDRIKVLLGKL